MSEPIKKDPVPEVEPPLFSAFFKNAIDGLKKIADFRFNKQVESRAKTISQLHAAVTKAERYRAFIEGAFWKGDLEPFFKDEAAKAQLRPWRPGDPITLEAFQAEHLFISGKAWMLSEILRHIGTCIKAGDDAQKELKFEQERNKPLKR